MNKKENYHIYSHKSPSITTLGELVSEPESLCVGFNITDLLNYQDENNNYNLDNLLDHYSQDELKKYDSLIQKIISKRVIVNDKTNTSLNNQNISTSTATTDNSKLNAKEFVKPKNLAALQELLKADPLFINHPISKHNKPFIDKLFDNQVRLLFRKFIYEIETKTNYTVEINNSTRSVNEQKKQRLAGNSASDFSYHMVGLAMDIKLINKTNTSLSLTKNSSNSEWIKASIIEISNRLLLTWGGTFSNVNPDPVHFDAQRYYNVDKEGFMKAASKSPDQQILSNAEEEVEVGSENINDNSTYSDLPIKIGTVLNLPLSNIDRDVLNTETNQTINSVDFESFLAKELVRLLSDVGYSRVYQPNENKKYKGTVQEIYPHISVWIWSRALSLNDTNDSNYTHKIINITPYVSSLNTTVAANGGNFNISVSPVIGDVINKQWSLRRGSQKNSNNDNKLYHVNSGHLHNIEDDELRRNNLFLEKAFQANDIVFIKFEKLVIEDNRDDLNELDIIPINKLPDQIFDMIGLVDNINITSGFENVDVNTSIFGRDLVKLLIEDGVYFYPTQFTDSGIFANTGATNNRLLRFNGEIKNRFQYSNKSIEKALKFLMNNLGEIEICPSSLFNDYNNKRSNFYQLTDKNSEAIDTQLQKISDKKEEVLQRISSIQLKNFLPKKPESVYSIIENFLRNLIQNDNITVQGQKIKSWTVTGNVNNGLPKELDKVFIYFDRYWVRNKGKVINKIGEGSTIDLLEKLYQKTDKQGIIENNLSLFNNLIRNKEQRSVDLETIDVVEVKDIISELDGYISRVSVDNIFDDVQTQTLFNLKDVADIKNAYNPTLTGNTISLYILVKLFDELSEDEKDVLNQIYNIIVEESSLKKDTKTTEELKPMLGVWSIIKLVIDDSVKDRRLADASIGNENGSLLNAVRKICQDPFCEFYTDTYGDQFYFIARKKPFDYESIKSMLDGRVVYEKANPTSRESEGLGTTRPNTTLDPKTVYDSTTIVNQKLIIDIEEKDVLNDSLEYSTEAYSWYKLQLANLTSGSQSDMAFAYLRAIYFEEFADIYGSKPLDLTTSYIPYSPILDKKKKLNTAYFIKQGVYDLKYMIESHAYLPFTRNGTITINGDRRIKRGTFVRYKSTGEIFYVDSISHSWSIANSIDRTTTIQVSRGMVEKYIDGVSISNRNVFTGTGPVEDEKDINISYFNICSLPIDENIFKDVNSSYSSFSEGSISKWKVNKEVFNFFLKKLQFEKK